MYETWSYSCYEKSLFIEIIILESKLDVLKMNKILVNQVISY